MKGYPFSWINLINQFLMILLIGLPFIFSGELAISTGISFAYNFQFLLLDFAFSGSHAGISPYRVFQSEPNYLTGGLIAPEGGAFGLLMFLIGCGLIYFYIRTTRKIFQIQTPIADYIPAIKPEEKGSKPRKEDKQKPPRSKTTK